MESVSRKYALSNGEADLKFMPFLQSLLPQSVVCDRHYSSGVDTDHGVFTLFTGLFPVAQPIEFDERKDLWLPTLFSFLSGTHHSFFVTGSDLRLWYPQQLLKNTGLQEIIDSSNSTALAHGSLEWTIRDEAGTGDIFSQLIEKTSEPFVGVYYPYATHWPYTIYAREENISNLNKLERYGYNLRIVDDQIKKVFGALSNRGILDHTIVVITADHGEAFGEHGAWGHGVTLFDINVHTPMIIYQPRVFTPRHISAFTSHADILPTLLDALVVNYDPAQFQGESLFRPRTRPYLFFYAPHTNLLGSIDVNGQKLVVDFAKNTCWTVNLSTDPEETSPAPCDRNSAQLAALLIFRRYNGQMLSNLASEKVVANNSRNKLP